MRGELLRVSGRWSLSAHLFMRERFSLTYFPLLTYYENLFRKKFSYCGGGRKPMKVYPFIVMSLSKAPLITESLLSSNKTLYL